MDSLLRQTLQHTPTPTHISDPYRPIPHPNYNTNLNSSKYLRLWEYKVLLGLTPNPTPSPTNTPTAAFLLWLLLRHQHRHQHGHRPTDRLLFYSDSYSDTDTNTDTNTDTDTDTDTDQQTDCFLLWLLLRHRHRLLYFRLREIKPKSNHLVDCCVLCIAARHPEVDVLQGKTPRPSGDWRWSGLPAAVVRSC